ncbi:MAG: ABC transporter permease [Tissierellia bacterium]|nr:ABC transporter permease [Tissierellia bacterium]
MKNINNVFKFEMKMLLSQKSIWIITIIYFLAMLASTIMPTLFSGNVVQNLLPGNTPRYSVLIEDDIWNEKDILSLYKDNAEVNFPTDEDTFVKSIQDNSVSLGLVLGSNYQVKVVRNNKSINDDNDNILKPIRQYVINQDLLKAGYDADSIEGIINKELSVTEELLGKNNAILFMPLYVMIFIIYILLIVFGSTISSIVAREKNDRTMELLIASTSSTSLITGKVLAGALISIFSLSFSGLGAIAGNIVNRYLLKADNSIFSGSVLSWQVFAVYAAFFFVGYLMYLYVYATLGASVNRIEEVNAAVGPVTMAVVVSFLFGMFALNRPDSFPVVIASFIPLSSPFTMFVRYAMGVVPIWQLALSFIILIFTAIASAIMSTKQYRKATLNYGGKQKKKLLFKRKSA